LQQAVAIGAWSAVLLMTGNIRAAALSSTVAVYAAVA
jgi:hypothetical protein